MPRLEDDTPYVAFGNEELAALPRVTSGDRVTCAHCAETHTLRGSRMREGDGPWVDSDLLLYFTCGDTTCLGAVGGRLLFGHQKAD